MAKREIKPRNSFALAAMSRKGGPMKHRLEPRGGAKDDQADLLEDYGCEDCDGEDRSSPCETCGHQG